MKTKYKIIIASLLVLSMLTAFAVTSFAAVTTSDITYDNNTYTYAGTIGSTSNWFEVSNLTKFEVVIDGNSTIYTNTTNSNIVMCLDDLYEGPDGMDSGLSFDVFSGNREEYSVTPLNSSTLDYSDGDYINIILYGDYTIKQYNPSTREDIDVSNFANGSEYNVYVYYSGQQAQYNILNANQPNPLDKVNDFLGYLSTALNKLTTMIITNQILILFIVAVPVVSFVIGSFKRIKDAGRA